MLNYDIIIYLFLKNAIAFSIFNIYLTFYVIGIKNNQLTSEYVPLTLNKMVIKGKKTLTDRFFDVTDRFSLFLEMFYVGFCQ